MGRHKENRSGNQVWMTLRLQPCDHIPQPQLSLLEALYLHLVERGFLGKRGDGVVEV